MHSPRGGGAATQVTDSNGWKVDPMGGAPGTKGTDTVPQFQSPCCGQFCYRELENIGKYELQMFIWDLGKFARRFPD